MKCIVHQLISRKKLARVLPKALATRIPKRLREPITAAYITDKVVTGRIMEKTLDHLLTLAGTSHLVAANDFTEEAINAAAAAGVKVLRVSSFGWTDAGLVEIRTIIGTHVKDTPEGLALIKKAKEDAAKALTP